MSMASPTLRSSSTMVPRASLSSWLTSMALLPSTAETVTGTSNTASRSAAECLGAASEEDSEFNNAAWAPAPSWLRSGRSTLSVAMALSFHGGRKVLGDEGGQSVFDGLFAAFRAAAAPFDAAVAGLHARLGGDHDAAVIAFFMRDCRQAGFDGLGNRGGCAQGYAGFADRLVHGLAQRHLHIAGGQGRQRGGGNFLGHGKRHAGGFIAQAFDL